MFAKNLYGLFAEIRRRPAARLLVGLASFLAATVPGDAQSGLLDGQTFFPVGVYNYPMQVITNSSQPYTGVYCSRTMGDRDVNHLAELGAAFNVIVLDDHGQDLEPADTCMAADIQNCRQHGLAVIKSFDCSGTYNPAWLAQTNQLQTGSLLYQSLMNTLHVKNLLWIETKDEASFGDDPGHIYPGSPWPSYEQFTNVNSFIRNTETNHPLWYNDGNYLGLPGSDRIMQLQKWGQWCDIYSEDLYPVFTNASNGTVGDPASNLDWVRSDIAPAQPNFMVLQGSGGAQNGYAPTNGQCASYLQTRSMAWDAIVHGALGVMWWGTFFLDRNGSEWANFKSAGRELTRFAPMLAKHNLTSWFYRYKGSSWTTNSMNMASPRNTNLEFVCFEYAGNHWLVGVNKSYSSQSGTIQWIQPWNATGPNLSNAAVTLAPLEVRIWSDQSQSTNSMSFPGGFVSVFNDNSTNFSYTGSWGYDSGRGLGDWQDDAHYAVNNGDSVKFNFSGIGVDCLTETYLDEGNVAVYVDGVSNATVNCVSTNRLAQQVVYSIRNLAPGAHTLKLMKMDGSDMLVDGCYVYAAQIPAAPTNFTVEAGSSHIALSWPKDHFATGYNLYRRTAPGTEALYAGGLETPFFADTNVVRGTVYYYQVAATNSTGESERSAEVSAVLPSLSIYSLRVLADSPLAYYPLDEIAGTTAYDLSGHHCDGTYTNSPTLGIAGPSDFLSRGVSFNEASQSVSQWSNNQWVNLGNPAALNIGGNITLEAWVKPVYANTPNYYENVLGRGYNTGTGTETALRLNGMDSYQVGIYSYALGGRSIAAGNPAASAGQWVHLVGTYDGTCWNLYTNGVFAGKSPSTTGALAGSDNWAIGNGTGGGDGRFYLGPVSHAAIYNYALSASQIHSHYLAGVAGTLAIALELSGTNAILTWPGGTLQQADAITGPFSDVANAVSPFALPLTATNKFFRVKF